MSETDESATNQPQDTAVSEPATAVRRPAAGVAWLALLLAVIAIIAVGYTIYEDWRTQRDLELSSGNIEASITNVAARIEATKQSLTAIDAQLVALEAADRNLGSKLELLERDFDDRLQRLDALPVRTDNLETAMAALQGASAGARDTWLLGEAEYYLQMANAQLQLAGNPQLAELALGVADERIAQLANPALTNVRIAIADERATLNALTTPDVEGITLQLASLARTVADLPLRRVEHIDDDAMATEEDLGPLDRAWASIQRATSGLVRHRTVDEKIMPLISPEAEHFLRTNLTLQLQAARLALLRGEQAVYATSLADAANWLGTYFDTGSEAVSAALQTVNTLQGGMFDVATPDISGSLQLLRQYHSIAGPRQ